MQKNLSFLMCGLATIALVGCNNPSTTTADSNVAVSNSGTAPDAGKKLSIAVIPKGTTHVYWKSMEAGARKAGTELGVDIQWKGPLKESDRAGQIAIVDQFVSEGVSAIVLAPLDDVALVKPVRSAAAKKIPVVIVDSAIKATPGKDYASIVTTNNFKGGVLGGERLAKLLGGKGNVVLLRYQEGSASTVEREAGFMSVMKKNPGITMISDNRYAGPTAGDAKDSAMNMVDKLKEANGIFCPNESSSFGMLLALRQNKLTGKVKFVGFDTSPQLVEGLNKGEIGALVAQDPTKMGYEGVKTAVAAIKGEKVEANIDTGVKLIDKDNINSAEIKALLGS